MKRVLLLSFVLVFALASLAGAALKQTPAEESNWERTTSSQEVVDYCKYVAENSGGRIRYETMGYSTMGKPMPMMIIGVPAAPKEPSDVPASTIKVYVQCNVHSGEVEGKEGMLIFSREVAEGKWDELLQGVVLLVNPNFNLDGNDFLGTWRANSQPTPKLVGTRYNAMGLNLNRDYTKIEAPETRSALRFMMKWDPQIIVDEHATDGLRHRMPMTYDWAKTLVNHPELTEANRLFAQSLFVAGSKFQELMDVFTPELIAKGKIIPSEQSDFIPPYSEGYSSTYQRITNSDGKLEDTPTQWSGGGDSQPRFTNALPGVRNRFGLLFEVHSHNEFEYRTRTAYSASVSLFNEARKQKDSIMAVQKKWDDHNASRPTIASWNENIILSGTYTSADWTEPSSAKTVQPTLKGMIKVNGLRFSADVNGDRLRNASAVGNGASPANITTTAQWEIVNWQRFIVPSSTLLFNPVGRMGALYVIEPYAFEGVQLLQRHGIEVRQLTEDVVMTNYMQFYDPSYGTPANRTWGSWRTGTISGDTVVNAATTLAVSGTAYEGHRTISVATISADWFLRTDNVVAPKGYYVISTAQQAGNYASFMLEPKANDGLCFWNYYDSGLNTSERALGSFDLRKTYTYNQELLSKSVVIDLVPDQKPTPNGDVLDTVPITIAGALPSGIVLGQEAAYSTLNEEITEIKSILPRVTNVDGRNYLADPKQAVSNLLTTETVESAVSMPIARFSVSAPASTGVVTIGNIEGKDLLADVANKVRAFASTKSGNLAPLTQVYSPADLTDGTFMITTSGTGYILQPNDPITDYGIFDVTVAVKDGGNFDLLSAAGVVGNNVVFAKIKSGDGSCSGCNAFAYPLLFLMFIPAAAFILKKYGK